MTKQDHDKIIQLEGKVDSLAENVSEIKDNHLVHIAQEVQSLKDKVDSITIKLAMWSGGIVVAVWALEKVLE